MNKMFDTYLAMLESKAPASQKADFHAARELYRKEGLPKFEGIWDMVTGKFGKAPSQSTFGDHKDQNNAKRTPEQVAQDKENATKIKTAIENFPKAAETINTVAAHDPGKVHAWVDFRLTPAIKRAMNTPTQFNTVDEIKAGAKEAYKESARQFKDEDAEAKAAEKQKMQDSLAKADEFEKEKKAKELAANSEKKLDEVGKNRDYKWDNSMSVGATDTDVNQKIATRRSEDMQNKEKADADIAAAQKWWDEHGETPAFHKAMTGEEMKKNEDSRQKAEAAKQADDVNDWINGWGLDESVSIKGLRAAFESVYGDSKEFSDSEIRAICASCYARRNAQ